jgi:hypothetical protein
MYFWQPFSLASLFWQVKARLSVSVERYSPTAWPAVYFLPWYKHINILLDNLTKVQLQKLFNVQLDADH